MAFGGATAPDRPPSAGALATNTPWPCRISTTPIISRPFNASRTVERPTPMRLVSSRSGGSRVPAGSSRTASRICCATVSASFFRGACWIDSSGGRSSVIGDPLPLDQLDLDPIGVEDVSRFPPAYEPTGMSTGSGVRVGHRPRGAARGRRQIVHQER